MVQAVIQLTQRCNYRCAFCFVNPLPGKHVNATPQTYGYLRALGKLGVSSVTLSGGEPTLVKDLLRVVETAKGLGMTVSLATNGSRPHHPALGMVDHVQLSLDGPRTIHNKVRGSRAAYANVIRCIDTVTAPVSVQVTVTEETVKTLAETVELLAELPVSSVSVVPVDSAGTSVDTPWLHRALEIVSEHYLRKPSKKRIFSPLAPAILARSLAGIRLRSGPLPWFIDTQSGGISLGSPSTLWHSLLPIHGLGRLLEESAELQQRAANFFRSPDQCAYSSGEVASVEHLIHRAVRWAVECSITAERR